MFRSDSWLYTQGSLLAVFWGSYRVLEIEPGLTACRISALPTV